MWIQAVSACEVYENQKKEQREISQEICAAIDAVDIKKFRALLAEASRDLLLKPMDNGDMLLRYTVKTGNAALVSEFLNSPHGKDCEVLNAVDERGQNVLMFAIQEEYVEIARELIAAGIDITVRTPCQKDFNIYDFSIEHGPLADKARENYTALHLAALMGDEYTVVELLGKYAEIDAKSRSRFTPLHIASAFGHANVVEILLNNGADISLTDNSGNSALDFAANASMLWQLIHWVDGSTAKTIEEKLNSGIIDALKNTALKNDTLFIETAGASFVREFSQTLKEDAVVTELNNRGGESNRQYTSIFKNHLDYMRFNSVLENAIEDRRYDIAEAMIAAGANLDASHSEERHSRLSVENAPILGLQSLRVLEPKSPREMLDIIHRLIAKTSDVKLTVELREYALQHAEVLGNPEMIQAEAEALEKARAAAKE